MNKKSLSCSLSIFSLSVLMASFHSTPKAITFPETREAIDTIRSIIYQPSGDQPPPTSETNTSGSRGGCEDFQRDIKLTPLVPRSHIGESSDLTPTLVWYLPEHQTPAFSKVKIWEFNDQLELSKMIDSSEPQKTRSGINQLDLSQTSIVLSPNTRYLWEVIIECGSENIRTSVEMQTVDDDSLTNTYWYDLLVSTFENPQQLDSLLTSLIREEKKNIEELQSNNRGLAAQTREHIEFLEKIRLVLNEN